MSDVSPRILAFLRLQSQPASPADIARGVGESASAVHLWLTQLVRAGHIRRIHCPDAVLKYQVELGVAEAPVNAVKIAARPAMARRVKPSPKSDLVLFALARANGSLTRDGIHATLNGALTRGQIGNLLQLLKQKDLVTPPRNGPNGAWRLTNPDAVEVPEDFNLPGVPVARAVSVPAQPETAAVAPRSSELPSPAIPNDERLVQLAQQATAGALEALASAPDRSQALAKIAAANSLLVEAHFIVRREHAP